MGVDFDWQHYKLIHYLYDGKQPNSGVGRPRRHDRPPKVRTLLHFLTKLLLDRA